MKNKTNRKCIKEKKKKRTELVIRTLLNTRCKTNVLLIEIYYD